MYSGYKEPGIAGEFYTKGKYQSKQLAINEIKNQLKLDNLSTICDRVENIKEQKFDIITSRAVADLSKIAEYALPLLKHNGYFVAYKSRKTQEEIGNATKILKRYKPWR